MSVFSDNLVFYVGPAVVQLYNGGTAFIVYKTILPYCPLDKNDILSSIYSKCLESVFPCFLRNMNKNISHLEKHF